MIVIVIEGVLAGDDLQTSPPTRWAKSLYAGMRSQHHVVVLTKADYEFARLWLKREHLDDVSRVIAYPPQSMFSWEDWRVDQVRGILSEGWEIFFYIDADAEVCAQVGSLGVCTLWMSYPPIPVGWKDVAAPRAWSDVVSTMDNVSGRGSNVTS